MKASEIALKAAPGFLIFLFSACHLQHAQAPQAFEGYKLVWSDEFNKQGRPDSSKWNYEKGFVRNEEAQWYQTENAWCEKGLLIIEGRRESKPNPIYEANNGDWRKKRPAIGYSSSSINTRFSWQY